MLKTQAQVAPPGWCKALSFVFALCFFCPSFFCPGLFAQDPPPKPRPCHVMLSAYGDEVRLVIFIPHAFFNGPIKPTGGSRWESLLLSQKGLFSRSEMLRLPRSKINQGFYACMPEFVQAVDAVASTLTGSYILQLMIRISHAVAASLTENEAEREDLATTFFLVWMNAQHLAIDGELLEPYPHLSPARWMDLPPGLQLFNEFQFSPFPSLQTLQFYRENREGGAVSSVENIWIRRMYFQLQQLLDLLEASDPIEQIWDKFGEFTLGKLRVLEKVRTGVHGKLFDLKPRVHQPDEPSVVSSHWTHSNGELVMGEWYLGAAVPVSNRDPLYDKLRPYLIHRFRYGDKDIGGLLPIHRRFAKPLIKEIDLFLKVFSFYQQTSTP